MKRQVGVRSPVGRRKTSAVMREFYEGRLHSGGSGQVVTDVDQAKAIGMSEGRRLESGRSKKSSSTLNLTRRRAWRA